MRSFNSRFNRTKKNSFNTDRSKNPDSRKNESIDSLHEWNLKTLEELFGKEYVSRFLKSN
ncbi:hypothetical protein UZ36_02630 [Candidatus Nitromaritima sp. SCGC AAA799-C22]|nr:hypothetical protein UZ36_02630 [Candidatus Nitromaritima sp. SCGC AAA799-C22]